MFELYPTLTILVALVAVLFAPLIQLKIAKKQLAMQSNVAIEQIKATTLSGNRQDWIHRLRENIAEYLALLTAIHGSVKLSTHDNARRLEKFEQASVRLNMVKLLLNPKEKDHQDLIDLLEHMLHALGNDDIEDFKTTLHASIEGSQSILKREWERVKARA